jgi:hypothetical protein
MISRRVFGIGALAMAGDGLVRPVGAPRGQATPVGVQPGTSNVVTARIVIITGAGDGAFAYIGAPGPGNPPVSWLTGGGLVDPYGNVLPSTMGVEGNGTFSVTGTAGQLFVGDDLIAIVPAGGGSSAIFGAAGPGVAYMVSGTEPAADSEAFFYLLSTLASGTFGAPQAILSATLVASVPGGPATTAETWHSLGSAGATGCTLLQARYRITPEGECEIDIALEAGAGGSTAGTYTWSNTLPADYQFPGSFLRVYPMPFNAPITTATQDSVIVVDGAAGPVPGRVRMTIPAVAANVFFTGTCRIPLS